MKKYSLALDLDNTLIDIMSPLFKVINQRDNTNYSFSDIDIYNHPIVMKHIDFIDSSELYDQMVPTDEAINFFNEMKKNYEVSIVTHTLDGHKEAKIKFIDKYFSGVDVCLTGENKEKFIKEKILVDDRPSNVESHVNKGYYGIMFTLQGRLAYSKTNNPKVLIADHYHEVSMLIKKIQNGWNK